MRALIVALSLFAPAVASAQACPVTLSDAACDQGINLSFTHWRSTADEPGERRGVFGAEPSDPDWVANLMEVRGRWQALEAGWGRVNAYGALAATYFSPDPDADARFDAVSSLEAGAAARLDIAEGITVPVRVGLAFQPEDREAGYWLLRGRAQDRALAGSDGLTLRTGAGVSFRYDRFLFQLDGNADLPLGDDPIRDRAVVGAGAMMEGQLYKALHFQAELALSTPLEEAEVGGEALEDPTLANLGLFVTGHTERLHLAVGVNLPLAEVGEAVGFLANLGFSL